MQIDNTSNFPVTLYPFNIGYVSLVLVTAVPVVASAMLLLVSVSSCLRSPVRIDGFTWKKGSQCVCWSSSRSCSGGGCSWGGEWPRCCHSNVSRDNGHIPINLLRGSTPALSTCETRRPISTCEEPSSPSSNSWWDNPKSKQAPSQSPSWRCLNGCALYEVLDLPSWWATNNSTHKFDPTFLACFVCSSLFVWSILL